MVNDPNTLTTTIPHSRKETHMYALNFQSISDMMHGRRHALGVTVDDEPIDFSWDDRYSCWRTKTCQENGWTRVSYFHADGTIENIYEPPKA